jgi:uncharacterized protein with HEPN domain
LILKPNTLLNGIFFIGEAVARIDKSFKDKHPSVDWREVKAGKINQY